MTDNEAINRLDQRVTQLESSLVNIANLPVHFPIPIYQSPCGKCMQKAQFLQQMISFDVPGPLIPTKDWPCEVAELEACVKAGCLSQSYVDFLLNGYKLYAAKAGQEGSGQPGR